MRRHLLLFFSALFLLVACKDNKGTDDVIEKDKMALILSDVHLVDGTMMTYGAKDSLYKYGTNRYALLFRKYGIDSPALNRSVKYYTARPDEMIEIYDRIEKILKAKTDSISKVQAMEAAAEAKKMDAKSKAEKKRRVDSLKRDSAKIAEATKLKLSRRIKK
jgi:hypothetical protein